MATPVAPNRSYNDWTQLEQELLERIEEGGYTKSEVDTLLAAKASTTALSDEATARETEDTRLDGLIDSLDATKAAQTDLEAETTRAEGIEENLENAITAETTNRTNADTAIRTDVNAAMEQEASARQAADTQLQANIDGKAAQSALEKEVEDREDADETLQDNIDLKQDILTAINGIFINAQKQIGVLIDGTTIKLNSQGLLYCCAGGGTVSMGNIDAGGPDAVYMTDQYIDGGYPDTEY